MTVFLVGAGPGDPGLLTVRAASLLRRADVVVHDRLVEAAVVDLAPPWAERVNVGKAPGRRGVSQERIHETLLDRSRSFGCVVRLKGGDPFVFGRGGDEAEALRAAGVDVEVVPGVTSAVAAPAAAGIPVTLRGESSGFTVVTAHRDPTDDTMLNWDCLAHSGATLVVLMGAARAALISKRLLAAGMAPCTPVAVVTSATTSRQRVDRTTLEGLGSLEVTSPAVIVIGSVAALDMITGHGTGTLTPPSVDEGAASEADTHIPADMRIPRTDMQTFAGLVSGPAASSPRGLSAPDASDDSPLFGVSAICKSFFLEGVVL